MRNREWHQNDFGVAVVVGCPNTACVFCGVVSGGGERGGVAEAFCAMLRVGCFFAWTCCLYPVSGSSGLEVCWWRVPDACVF